LYPTGHPGGVWAPVRIFSEKKEFFMAIRELALEEKRHEYPFLVEGAFDWREGERYDPGTIGTVVDRLLAELIRREARRRGDLESLLGFLGKNLKQAFGIEGQTRALEEKLRAGGQIIFPLPMTQVVLHLRRYGECVGINAVDPANKTHLEATEILESLVYRWTPEKENGMRYFHRFVQSRSIRMSRDYANERGRIDVAGEIESLRARIPDVGWATDSCGTAQLLFDGYRSAREKGIVVGSYHDVPVFLRVLYGRTHAVNWRRGASELSGSTLQFRSDSSEDLLLEYSIEIAGQHNSFADPPKGIDYVREQQMHQRLARILFDAFWARDLAETVTHNPHWVKWRPERIPAAT
jgi:hypothetical protein